MNPSWKTSVCGLLAALFLGLSQISELPPLAIKILTLLAGLMPAVGLLFARDNKVTSEQVLNSGHAGATTGKTLPLIACLLAPALLFSTGCRNLDPAGPYQGDKLAYEADRAIVTGYEVLHDFVTWERANRAGLTNHPGVKRAADHVRLNAKTWLDTAIAAREAYTAAPSPDNRDKLTRSVAVLRTAISEAVKYLETKPHNP